MMASTRETPIRRALVRHGRALRLLASLLAALSACRAGLPPEPPGDDPADPNAPATPYQVQANPYEISAFADAPAESQSGHEHMDHGAAAHAGHGHMGHGGGAEETSHTKTRSEHGAPPEQEGTSR